MSQRQATITDVAQATGVSKGLVSLAMNDRPGVAPATRQRILAAAKKLNFRPSVPARSLSLRTSFALGLVIRRPAEVLSADPFFPRFISGVEKVLSVQGRALVLSVVPDSETELRTYRTLVRDKRVDGVFLSDLRRDDPRPELLATLGLPAVTLGHPEKPSAFPTVSVDDTHGVTEAVEHLVTLGHRRIAHVTGDQVMLHGLRRRDTFTETMRNCRLDPGLVVAGDFSADSGASATAELMGLAQPPTAIVYANDSMAIAGMGVLQRAGLAVPHDVSLTGFDASELSAYVHPPLTTVSTDPARWGETAAQTLLTYLADRHPRQLQLPPNQLLIRSSTTTPQPGR